MPQDFYARVTRQLFVQQALTACLAKFSGAQVKQSGWGYWYRAGKRPLSHLQVFITILFSQFGISTYASTRQKYSEYAALAGGVMKGDTKVLGYLNKVLTMELTSINQYFLHARMFKSWGFGELDKKEYKKSIKDMKQADDLIERIFFLEGLPNLQNIEKLRIGEDAEEMLKCDLELQTEQLVLLCEAIAYCETQGDYVSRELLEDILAYEEEHVDWIETQQELLRNIGSENYLQSQM